MSSEIAFKNYPVLGFLQKNSVKDRGVYFFFTATTVLALIYDLGNTILLPFFCLKRFTPKFFTTILICARFYNRCFGDLSNFKDRE